MFFFSQAYAWFHKPTSIHEEAGILQLRHKDNEGISVTAHTGTVITGALIFEGNVSKHKPPQSAAHGQHLLGQACPLPWQCFRWDSAGEVKDWHHGSRIVISLGFHSSLDPNIPRQAVSQSQPLGDPICYPWPWICVWGFLSLATESSEWSNFWLLPTELQVTRSEATL